MVWTKIDLDRQDEDLGGETQAEAERDFRQAELIWRTKGEETEQKDFGGENKLGLI